MAISDVIAKIQDLQRSKATAGFYETSIYPDWTHVAEVAFYQEFGADLPHVGNNVSIPARPFLRPAIENYKSDWADVAKNGILEMVGGNLEPMQVQDRIGMSMQGDIVKQITEPDKTPLSKVTLLLRKWKEDSARIGLKDVHEAIAIIKRNPGVEVSNNTTPLNETGYMINSVAYEVRDNEPS